MPAQNLRIPGPTPLPDRVREAGSRQMVNHRGPEFKALLGRVTEDGDGVVTVKSAHLDGASEITVAADHLEVHRHPLAILEVRRILLEHLGALSALIAPPTQSIQTFAGPDLAAPGSTTWIAEPVTR